MATQRPENNDGGDVGSMCESYHKVGDELVFPRPRYYQQLDINHL